MSDTKRWAHPKAMERWGGTEKSLTRDRTSWSAKVRLFQNGARADLGTLRAKTDELRLREAFDDGHVPRHRKNHRDPRVRDGGKAWNRMLAHSAALAWKEKECSPA